MEKEISRYNERYLIYRHITYTTPAQVINHYENTDEMRWYALRNIPSEILTKEVAISICEDIINHFNIPNFRENYCWKEKEGKLNGYHNFFGWHTLIGPLLYETGVRHRGLFKQYHPDVWSIVKSKLPQQAYLF